MDSNTGNACVIPYWQVDGKTALHAASEEEDVDIVRTLIAAGANVHTKDVSSDPHYLVQSLCTRAFDMQYIIAAYICHPVH